MQVIAGKARRLLLATVPGLETRPTTDRIKETLFNILMPEIPGCRFLDLFAGSGAIGIEALSRGAEEAVFADNSRRACACIRQNLEHTKLKDQATVLETDAVAAIRRLSAGGKKFDIVFLDPPYDADLEFVTLKALTASNLLTDESLIIVECREEKELKDLDTLGLRVAREKVYKNNKHVFLRKETAHEEN